MFRAVQRVLSSRNDHRFIVIAVSRNITSDNSKVTARDSQQAKRFNSTDTPIRKNSTRSGEMVKAKKYVLVKHFVNDPKPTDLQLVEEELPPLQNEGINRDNGSIYLHRHRAIVSSCHVHH